MDVTKSFMFYLRSRVFPEKSLFYFFKFLHNIFWDSCYKQLENNFWYLYCFKDNDFPFECKICRFPYFQRSLNICCSFIKILFLFKFFVVIEYLIFEYLMVLTYCYLDLYNAYQRLPLELLSGLQYLKFQILLNLVLMQKNRKKI